MYRFKRPKHAELRSLGIAMLTVVTIVVAAAMNGSCFGTETTLCEESGLRCRPDQVCAANQPVCIESGGCGDNHLDRAKGEICDDGNIIDGDGCSRDCKSMEICGNGIIDTISGEECDDGNRTDGDGCSSSCKAETCGDKVVGTNEQCDTGGDSLTCNHDCTVAKCGDGYPNVAAGEERDQIEIFGSKGKISFSVFEMEKITITENGKTEVLVFDQLQHVQQPIIEKIVEHFLGEGPNPCSGDDGAQVMWLIDQFVGNKLVLQDN